MEVEHPKIPTKNDINKIVNSNDFWQPSKKDNKIVTSSKQTSNP